MAGKLHVVFNDSAAASLREALADRPGEEVLCIPDYLSIGPIDPPDPGKRHAWLRHSLGCPEADIGWHPDEAELSWQRLLDTPARRVLWYSRHHVDEWCGAMEALLRIGDAACDSVEFTRDRTVLELGARMPRIPILGFAELRPDEFRRFLERPRPLDAEERRLNLALWARLRADNAPLRVPEGDTLRSASFEAFDADLLALATRRWQKVAMIIATFWLQEREPSHRQANWLLLAHRIRVLAARGLLEAAGDLTRPRYSEVRLPDKGAHDNASAKASA